ncbi:MAG: hypothetical protein HPY53_06340 [Brevinematales bacterium]|nr:hypothetical protein [Brevinematales bacterium]
MKKFPVLILTAAAFLLSARGFAIVPDAYGDLYRILMKRYAGTIKQWSDGDPASSFSTVYKFDLHGWISEIKDPTGNFTVTYDANRTMITVEGKFYDQSHYLCRFVLNTNREFLSVAIDNGASKTKTSILYTYNANGKLTEKKVIVTKDGKEKALDLKYLYDGSGNLLEENTYENGEALTYKQEYVCDASGCVLEKTSFYKSQFDNKPKLTEKNVYTYDSANNVTSVKVYDYNGTLKDIMNYAYNSQKNIVEKAHILNGGKVDYATMYHYSGDELKVLYSYTYKGGVYSTVHKFLYDANGNLIQKYRFTPEGKLDGFTKYILNQKNKITDEVYYNEKTQVEYTLKYTYDAKGNLTEQNEVYPDNSKGYRYVYAYDAKGFLTLETDYDPDGKIDSTYKYVNNPAGKSQELTCAGPDGKMQYRIEYLYTPEGKLAKEKKYNQDNMLEYTYQYIFNHQGQVMEERKITPAGDIEYGYLLWYNNKGRLITKKEYSPGSQLEGFDIYTYDAKGNLVLIETSDANGNPVKKQEYRILYWE